MLVIVSPIYYHGVSGQLKCTLDRFYSAAYPSRPRNLKKVAMILSSGNPAMYDGAMFSYKEDFLEYLGLEDMGVFTAYGGKCTLWTCFGRREWIYEEDSGFISFSDNNILGKIMLWFILNSGILILAERSAGLYGRADWEEKMKLTKLHALQIAKRADVILHVPGNYRGGNLEMAVVIDTSLEQEEMQEAVAEVARALKRSNEIFRNVRLNLVLWGPEISVSVVPMAMLMSGSAFAGYSCCPCVKRYEDLFSYLKKFHARSKVILVFADERNETRDRKAAKEALTPFLKSKLLLISEQITSGMQFFLKL